jgi:hypothetical protein
VFKFSRKGEPVEMRSQHGFFDPTRPWSRLYDLQEGKTWRVVYFNPALDSLKQSMLSMVPGLGAQLETPIIEGGVLTGTEELLWDNRQVPCQVIEYRGETMTGKTYVRKSDGLVLRQEVEYQKSEQKSDQKSDQKSTLTMSLMRRPR